jgi:hypothetical protein
MSVAIWTASAVAATPICLLVFRVVALLIAYRLAVKVKDLDAVTKVSDLAGVLGGKPLTTRLRKAPRGQRAVGGDVPAQR